MTLRSILHYPDNRLRQLCPNQTEYNDDLRKLISDMFETMYHEKGIGLSAIQINVITRVITIDVSKDENDGRIVLSSTAKLLFYYYTPTHIINIYKSCIK